MGYLDDEGIYHPQHGERGWGDEMNTNLSALSLLKAFSSEMPVLHLYRSVPTSIPNAAWTNITWDPSEVVRDDFGWTPAVPFTQVSMPNSLYISQVNGAYADSATGLRGIFAFGSMAFATAGEHEVLKFWGSLSASGFYVETAGQFPTIVTTVYQSSGGPLNLNYLIVQVARLGT